MTDMETLRVNGPRLIEHLDRLAAIGAKPGGAMARMAYSDADIEGREFVMSLMRDASLEVRVDTAGNILGRREGTEREAAPIAFGSHIDTVPDGGRYDGALGVLAGIECARVVHEAGVATPHPLEVTIFNNEEGGLIGSRAMVGDLTEEELDHTSQSGHTHRDGIRRIGGEPDRLPAARRSRGDVHAYLELHVEQGGRLEESGTAIGIVEGIVCMRWEEVTLQGAANHAGTTRMDRRRDALVAAARLIQNVNEIARATPGDQVATVGRLEVLPGAPNIVPGRVIMTVEIRDLSPEKVEAMGERVVAGAERIAADTGVEIRFRRLHDIHGAPTHPRVRGCIERAARSLDLSFRLMPSGAGHDAQSMAAIAPVGMIFVPSVGGVSHAPEEYTRPEDLVNGANVLLQTILRLDAEGLDERSG